MGSEKVEIEPSRSQQGNISLFTEQLDNSVKRFGKEDFDISNNNNYFKQDQDQDQDQNQSENPKENSNTSGNMGLFGISLKKPTLSKPNRRKISKLLTDIKTTTETQAKEFKTFVVRSSSQMSSFVRSVGQSPTKIPSISEIRSAFAGASSSKFESESSYSLISDNCEYDDIVYPNTHLEDSHDENFGSIKSITHLEKIPTVEELINKKI